MNDKDRLNWIERRLDMDKRLNAVLTALNGGKGSGNFGHKGRPGIRGGSGNGKGMTAAEKAARTRKSQEAKWKGNNVGAGGVPGDIVPTTVPDQPCPDATAKAIYEKYADVYNDPKKQKEAVEYLLNNTYKDGVFEVDAAKEILTERKTIDEKRMNQLRENASDALSAVKDKQKLTPKQKQALDDYYSAIGDAYVSGWGSKAEMEALKYLASTNGDKKAAEKLASMKEFQQKYNTAVHGTAVCLAKKALESKVSELRAKGEKVDIFMTAGGCASGKGYGIETYQGKSGGEFTGDKALINEYKNAVKKANIVWDAAGDQNNTEIKWLKDKADSLTVSMTSNVNPNKVAADPDRGLVSRAATKGRMVDADVYANSYNIGAENLKVAMQLWGNEVKFVAYDGSTYGKCKIVAASDAIQMPANVSAIRTDISNKLNNIEFVTKLGLSQREVESIAFGANFTLNSK